MIKTKNGKTAPQYVKQDILLWFEEDDEKIKQIKEMTGDEIDNAYIANESDLVYDATNEMRCCYSEETNLPDRQYSRHYECKEVAYQFDDGTWVGWTYWYGGGKHGEPNAVDWISNAYFVECVEEEKLVVVRSFSIEEDNTNANPNA